MGPLSCDETDGVGGRPLNPSRGARCVRSPENTGAASPGTQPLTLWGGTSLVRIASKPAAVSAHTWLDARPRPALAHPVSTASTRAGETTAARN